MASPPRMKLEEMPFLIKEEDPVAGLKSGRKDNRFEQNLTSDWSGGYTKQDSETFSTWQIEESDLNEPALNLPSPVSAMKRDSRLLPPVHGNNNFLIAGHMASENSAGSRTNEEERHSNKQFSSVQCDMKLKNEGELRKHSKAHGIPSLMELYMCSLCNKRFNQSVDWNMHVNSVHTAQERFMLRGFDEKTYSCYYCNKKFKKLSDLRKHDRVNTGDLPFSCSKCQVKLERECDMWQHEQSHSENNSNKNKAAKSAVVKTFACSMCCKKFADIIALKQHEASVHEIKPFVCYFCDKGFKTYKGLSSHIEARHTNRTPAGSETNKRSTFNTLTDVKQLAQTQKSKRKLPFHCSECSMKFPNLLALNQHKTVHVSSQEKFSGNAFSRKIMAQQGWKSGQGLGADSSGITDPVDTRGQMTRAGLGYNELEEGVRPPLASKQSKINQCNKKPKKASSLLTLNQQKTAHVKPLSCPICDKKFAGPSVLKQHKRISHEAKEQKVQRKKKKKTKCQNKPKVKKDVKTDQFGFPDLFKSQKK